MNWLHRSVAAFVMVCAFIILLPADANAQSPLVLEWKTKIKFGTVAAEDVAGGTVTLSPAADTTVITGNLTDFRGTIKRGKLRITNGDSKAYVIVTLPSSFTMHKGTSAHTVTVSNVIHEPDQSGPA